MFKDRLEILINDLETMPERIDVFGAPIHFDMRVWFRETKLCGTACCALGRCTLIPEFQELGLQLNLGRTEVILPDGDRIRYSVSAAEILFGITHDQSYYIFIPSRYLTDEEKKWDHDPDFELHKIQPSEVIAHIRDVMEGRVASRMRLSTFSDIHFL